MSHKGIGLNRILNNLVQNSLGAYAIYVGCAPAVLDGNICHAKGPVQAFWKQTDGKKTYTLSTSQGLANYQRDTGQEVHSRIAEAAFADAQAGDFRLAPGCVAVDAGQPLTRTTATGAGSMIPVEDVSCFSAGLRTEKGKVLIPGDEIMFAGSSAQIIALDRGASTLTLDRSLQWRKGDPVSYVYRGGGPDVGAFETGVSEGSD